MDGAFLINKQAGVSSFGVIEILKEIAMAKLGVKHRDLPASLQKMGHGGTLDPFATGLLIVCVGRGVKLSRYFLGSQKSYDAVLRFGETTISGDPTNEISERSDVMPESLSALQEMAKKFSAQAYLQTPPMYSAKKRDGKPLYELARQGIEVEREAKLCHLFEFEFSEYVKPIAKFSVKCSSGTYIRTLSQDFSRLFGTVGMLDHLHRTKSGIFSVTQAMTTDEISTAIQAGTDWSNLGCFVDFDQLLKAYPRADATGDEATAILQGKQQVLGAILGRVPRLDGSDDSDSLVDTVTVYADRKLLAVAKRENGIWGLERVFPPRE